MKTKKIRTSTEHIHNIRNVSKFNETQKNETRRN